MSPGSSVFLSDGAVSSAFFRSATYLSTRALKSAMTRASSLTGGFSWSTPTVEAETTTERASAVINGVKMALHAFPIHAPYHFAAPRPRSRHRKSMCRPVRDGRTSVPTSVPRSVPVVPLRPHFVPLPPASEPLDYRLSTIDYRYSTHSPDRIRGSAFPSLNTRPRPLAGPNHEIHVDGAPVPRPARTARRSSHRRRRA